MGTPGDAAQDADQGRSGGVEKVAVTYVVAVSCRISSTVAVTANGGKLRSDQRSRWPHRP